MNSTLSLIEVKTELINHLEEDNTFERVAKDKIITVMNGYGKRDGLFNQLNWIIYRIWNAIKSLFAQSDWQLASNSLSQSNHAILYAHAEATYMKVSSSEEVIQKFQLILQKEKNKLVEKKST